MSFCMQFKWHHKAPSQLYILLQKIRVTITVTWSHPFIFHLLTVSPITGHPWYHSTTTLAVPFKYVKPSCTSSFCIHPPHIQGLSQVFMGSPHCICIISILGWTRILMISSPHTQRRRALYHECHSSPLPKTNLGVFEYAQTHLPTTNLHYLRGCSWVLVRRGTTVQFTLL